MSETTRLLTGELARLRAEDRRREAALRQFLDEFGEKLAEQRQRDETVTGQLQELSGALGTFQGRLQEFERHLSKLAAALPKR